MCVCVCVCVCGCEREYGRTGCSERDPGLVGLIKAKAGDHQTHTHGVMDSQTIVCLIMCFYLLTLKWPQLVSACCTVSGSIMNT